MGTGVSAPSSIRVRATSVVLVSFPEVGAGPQVRQTSDRSCRTLDLGQFGPYSSESGWPQQNFNNRGPNLGPNLVNSQKLMRTPRGEASSGHATASKLVRARPHLDRAPPNLADSNTSKHHPGGGKSNECAAMAAGWRNGSGECPAMTAWGGETDGGALEGRGCGPPHDRRPRAAATACWP